MVEFVGEVLVLFYFTQALGLDIICYNFFFGNAWEGESQQGDLVGNFSTTSFYCFENVDLPRSKLPVKLLWS